MPKGLRGFQLSKKKIVFKVPVVRVQFDGMRFPKKCPVCGKEATMNSRISFATKGIQRASPILTSYPTSGVSHTSPSSIFVPRSLLLYVCDEHYRSESGDTNYKVICFVINVVLAAASVFVGLQVANHLWVGTPVDISTLSVLLAFPVSLLITAMVLRSGPLGSAVKVVGFDSGISNIWLQFTRDDYREAFMRENSEHAELVKWIMKS